MEPVPLEPVPPVEPVPLVVAVGEATGVDEAPPEVPVDEVAAAVGEASGVAVPAAPPVDVLGADVAIGVEVAIGVDVAAEPEVPVFGTLPEVPFVAAAGPSGSIGAQFAELPLFALFEALDCEVGRETAVPVATTVPVEASVGVDVGFCAKAPKLKTSAAITATREAAIRILTFTTNLLNVKSE